MFDPVEHGWKQIPVKAFFRRIGPLYAKRIGEGWEYGLVTSEEHENGAGRVHGGVLATFADQAFSTVAWEAAGRRVAATVSLDLHFANAVTPGQFVVARPRVVRTGNSLVFLTGLLTCDDQEVCVASGVWGIARA